MKKLLPGWLLLTLITLVLNGLWGALIEIPERRLQPAFPTSLGYIVWSITFIPLNLYVLIKQRRLLQFDAESIFKGLLPGLLGAGGQFLLFETLDSGPAYLVFPVVAMYPLLTVLLSLIMFKERAGLLVWMGIALAVVAVLLLSLQPAGEATNHGNTWFWLALLVFMMWGLQSFLAKLFLRRLTAESINFYVMISNFLFIPLALRQTDFSQPINWGLGLALTAFVQALNTIAVLITPFALRQGKLIVISPLSAMAPFVTTLLSLFIYQRMPDRYHAYGIVLSVIALLAITYGEARNASAGKQVLSQAIKTN